MLARMGVSNGAAGSGSAVTALLRPLPEDERPSGHTVRFVLIEDGTNGSDTSEPSDAGEPTVVVAQRPAEPPSAFAIRVVRRVLDLELSGRSVDSTLLLLSPRFD